MLHMRIVCCICVLHVAYAYCMLHAASPEGGDAVPALPDDEAVPWHSIAALSVVPAVASPRRALRLWQHIVPLRRRTLHRTLRRCNVPTIARCVLPSHRCTVHVLRYHSMLRRIVAHCTSRHCIASLPAAAPNRFRGSRKRSTRASGGSFSSSHGRQCACPTPTRRTLCGARRWRSSIRVPACDLRARAHVCVLSARARGGGERVGEPVCLCVCA